MLWRMNGILALAYLSTTKQYCLCVTACECATPALLSQASSMADARLYRDNNSCVVRELRPARQACHHTAAVLSAAGAHHTDLWRPYSQGVHRTDDEIGGYQQWRYSVWVEILPAARGRCVPLPGKPKSITRGP